MQKRKMINGFIALQCISGFLLGLKYDSKETILQQRGILLKQNPGEAHLTTEELQEIAVNNNTDTSLSKISRYISNISIRLKRI